jgi:hypothetical protein
MTIRRFKTDFLDVYRKMKWIFVVIIFVSFDANSQRRHSLQFAETIHFADSLEKLYQDSNLLQYFTDTLPLIANDDDASWRNSRLVRYSHDTLNRVKTIEFMNGQEGYYHFIFHGTLLRKVRVVRSGGIINYQYYFSDSDNNALQKEFNKYSVSPPGRKAMWELFIMAREFIHKFDNLKKTCRNLK